MTEPSAPATAPRGRTREEKSTTDNDVPVVVAWSRVMARATHLSKDRRATGPFSYNFRGIDDVMNLVGPILRDHGVVVVPETIRDFRHGTIPTKAGTSQHALLQVEFRVYGPRGDSFTITTVGEAMDSGDKSVSKAHSVALRVAYLQALCLPTDERDPDEDQYETVPEPLDRLARARESVWAYVRPRIPEDQQVSWIEGELQRVSGAHPRHATAEQWEALVTAISERFAAERAQAAAVAGQDGGQQR